MSNKPQQTENVWMKPAVIRTILDSVRVPDAELLRAFAEDPKCLDALADAVSEFAETWVDDKHKMNEDNRREAEKNSSSAYARRRRESTQQHIRS